MKAYLKLIFSNIVIQAILFALLLWLIYEIRLILIILLFAFIVMSGMKPLITRLQDHNWPRPLAILTPYLSLFLLLGLAGYAILPIIISQIRNLVTNIPNYIERATEFLSTSELPVGDLAASLPNLLQPGIDSLLFLPEAISVFFFAVATILFISIYLLWDPNYLYSKLRSTDKDENGQVSTIGKVERAMGMWLRGQIIIAFIVGMMTLVGLWIIGVEFALALALITALLEFIPYVGPIVAAIIALLVATGDSWLTVGLVAVLYLIIQQVESNLLVPQVMKRSVDLHPITVIISILIGSHFMGVIGALVAVPIATIGTVVFKEVQAHHHTT